MVDRINEFLYTENKLAQIFIMAIVLTLSVVLVMGLGFLIVMLLTFLFHVNDILGLVFVVFLGALGLSSLIVLDSGE